MTKLSDYLHDCHEHASYADNYPGIGLRAVREIAGLTREDAYEVTGMPDAWFELMEDFGGWPDVEQITSLASACDCSPGELIDAIAVICEAHNHDVQAELEVERQADKLWAMLQEHAAVGILNEELEAAGISTGNATYNVLYDRGLPVEIVRKREPQRSNYDRPIGIRIKSDG